WFCSVCPKSFGRKGDLTRHKLLHAGIKRHVCTICNKAFSQYSGLKTHKNVHTKVKPFVCGFNSCSASFGDPSSCARHRKETHRRVGAYRCPHPLCKSSIKRRSAFTAHLKKHNIDITYVDIDAMAPPLLPVAVSVPKRKPVQEITVIDVMPQSFEQAVDQARQMYFDGQCLIDLITTILTLFIANEFTLHQLPCHQTSIPWPYYGDSGIMPDSSVALSTLPSFNYDEIDLGSLFVMDSSSHLDSPVNLISSSSNRPKPSFEATLPGGPVIKTEDEMMANVPRTFDGIRFSSMFTRSAAYPFSRLPTYSNIYPDFKLYDFPPALPWVQPT
ncbi:hypothetical protein BYT27DRAFT_7086967, partial [Phlegmacium glaucopus]